MTSSYKSTVPIAKQVWPFCSENSAETHLKHLEDGPEIKFRAWIHEEDRLRKHFELAVPSGRHYA